MVIRSKPVSLAACGVLALTGGCGLFDTSEGTPDARSGGGDATDPGNGESTGDAAIGPDASPLDELPDRVKDYIRADDYTRLIIEVDYVEGMEPRDGVEDDIEDLFADVLDKPDGIEAIRDDVLAPRDSDDGWSIEELRDLADDNFDYEPDDDETVLHTLWVDGSSERDDDSSVILGLQFDRHIVLFKETIESVCQGAALPTQEERTCRRTERGIWIHEIGHAIGLVDNGLPMVEDHRDEERGAHSKHDDCIMYWAYSQGGLGSRVRDAIAGDEPELGFDEYCLNDIAAVRDAP